MWKSAMTALTAVVLIVAALLAGCGGDDDSSGGAAEGGAYKVGGILTLSGPAALLGQHELDGAKVAIKEINAAGGVNGKKIELDTIDTAANPNSAVSAFNRFSQQDDVISIFGATFGTETAAISPIDKRAKIPMIVPNTTAEGMADNPYIFLLAYTSEIEAEVARQYLMDNSITRAAILHTSDQYGTDGARFLAQMEGIEIVANESMDPDATDVTSQLTKIRGKRPEALLIWGTAPNTGIAIKNAGQLGIDVPIISGVAAHSPANIEVAAGSKALDNWRIQAVMDPNKPLPRQEEGAKALLAAYDYPPDVFSSVGYDGMYVLAEGLKKAGKDADRESLRNALEEISGYGGLAGEYTFNKDTHVGLGPDSILTLRVANNDFELVSDSEE